MLRIKHTFSIAALCCLALLAGSCNKAGEEKAAGTAASSTATDSAMPAGSVMEKPVETPQTAEMPPLEVKPGAPGTMAPDFTLTDMAGVEHSLASYLAEGKTVVLEWFNPGCSVVHYYYQESTVMVDTYNDVNIEMGDNVVWLAVISQDPTGRGGTDEEVNTAVTAWNIPYPVLRDGSGVTGKAYGATHTPALYIIAPDGTIQYNGGVDQFAKGGDMPPVGTNFILQCVSEMKAGAPVSVPHNEAIG
jgi:peroxiredoxin